MQYKYITYLRGNSKCAPHLLSEHHRLREHHLTFKRNVFFSVSITHLLILSHILSLVTVFLFKFLFLVNTNPNWSRSPLIVRLVFLNPSAIPPAGSLDLKRKIFSDGLKREKRLMVLTKKRVRVIFVKK